MRTRITISLSTTNQDAATVLHALERAPHWKRSAELVRWAAAYLNGEALVKETQTIEPALNEAELEDISALIDDF